MWQKIMMIMIVLSCSCLTVCKPCLDGWVLFQSNCYLFSKSNYYPESMGWQGSRDQCKQKMADLVVIESQEEQARLTSFD